MSANHYDVINHRQRRGRRHTGTQARAIRQKDFDLERGGYLPREKQNWGHDGSFRPESLRLKNTWHDKNDKPFQPGSHYFVGGATKMYGAALFRLRKEFHRASHR